MVPWAKRDFFQFSHFFFSSKIYFLFYYVCFIDETWYLYGTTLWSLKQLRSWNAFALSSSEKKIYQCIYSQFTRGNGAFLLITFLCYYETLFQWSMQDLWITFYSFTVFINLLHLASWPYNGSQTRKNHAMALKQSIEELLNDTRYLFHALVYCTQLVLKMMYYIL